MTLVTDDVHHDDHAADDDVADDDVVDQTVFAETVFDETVFDETVFAEATELASNPFARSMLARDDRTRRRSTSWVTKPIDLSRDAEPIGGAGASRACHSGAGLRTGARVDPCFIA